VVFFYGRKVRKYHVIMPKSIILQIQKRVKMIPSKTLIIEVSFIETNSSTAGRDDDWFLFFKNGFEITFTSQLSQWFMVDLLCCWEWKRAIELNNSSFDDFVVN